MLQLRRRVDLPISKAKIELMRMKTYIYRNKRNGRFHFDCIGTYRERIDKVW